MDAKTSRPGDSLDPAGRSHFDGREFHNLDGVPAGCSLWDLLRWKLLGGRVPSWPAHPGANTVASALPATLERGEMAATFVGHSTFLLQFGGGHNILTDPVWSERVSPFSFAGPRRFRPPALAFDALPPISSVLVSHAHYDHMDLPTLRRLETRFRPLFITGLGNGSFLRKQGLGRVEELDWWQSLPVPDPEGGEAGLEITFTPAQHWSARSATRRNRTLWGGFWLRQGTYNVFFAADTGFGRHFALVRERLGKPDVAFLPVGAYEPRWFMREQHMNPDDAVQAHRVLEAGTSVGIHFGTFQLTDESIDEPARALQASLREHSIPPDSFRVPSFGETLRFGRSDAAFRL